MGRRSGKRNQVTRGQPLVRRRRAEPCLFADDGSDALGQGRGDRSEHKTRQLCREVERHLSLVFAGELDDELLRGLQVCGVRACGGAALLEVALALPPDRPDIEPALVSERLVAISGWLRSEIASILHRKRTPQLAFTLISCES